MFLPNFKVFEEVVYKCFLPDCVTLTRGQFNKEITLVVFTCVIYACKVQLVKNTDSIKRFSTLEFTRVARVMIQV